MGRSAIADESDLIAREHAAMRRVATLVARVPSPPEVFAAVTEDTAVMYASVHAGNDRAQGLAPAARRLCR